MKQKYIVRLRYIFEGEYYLSAESEAEAQEKARQHCGLTLGGGIHSSLPDEEVDWTFSLHPDIEIVDVME